MPIQFGGPGVFPDLGGLTCNEITLQAGEVWTIPSGRWFASRGKFTTLQQWDPIAQFWRSIGAGAGSQGGEVLFSDGVNYRLANQTGCVVGAFLTNGGTLYTSPPVVTAGTPAASTIFRAIVGGAVSATVTVANGGTNYAYPPAVLFSPPPAGGIQATGHCTLSGSAVSTVTVDNQGAGYSSPPTIVFVNDPREGNNGVTLGYNASAVAALTGSGTVTGVLVIDHGIPQSYSAAVALPTLTFTGGGGSAAAASAIMDLSITSYAISATTTGSGYVAPTIVSAYGGFPAGTQAYANPFTQQNLVAGRNAFIVASILTGAFTATGQTVNDGGVYPGFPTMYVAASNVPGASPVAVVFLTPNMGGVSDTTYLMGT